MNSELGNALERVSENEDEKLKKYNLTIYNLFTI